MKILSVEFTSNHIYIYEQNCGKSEVTVEKKYKLDMPPNTYYNRMLINNDRRISDAIKNCVSENKIKTKKVVLTTSNTDCMVENISILNGSPKQIEGMVEQELRKRHKLNADYLYDYVVLGPDPVKEGFLSVQVTLCVKAMIQNAYQIIKKAGLIPYRIIFVDHAMEAIAKQYQLTKASENSIVACVNRDEAHYLYVGHGQEPYYRYSKLQLEQRMEENFFILSNINKKQEDMDWDTMLQRKVAEDLTRLKRFHSQRNPGKEIANVYLYGCYEGMQQLADSLEGAVNIPTQLITFKNKFSNVRYGVKEEEGSYNGIAATMASLWEKERQYDFFGRMEKEQDGGGNKFLFVPSVIAAVVFLGILIVSLSNYAKAKKFDRQAQELMEMLASTEVQQAYEQKNEKIETCSAYTKYNNQVTEAIGLLETMPRFEGEIIQSVEDKKPEGTEITGYMFSEGTLNLGCYATDRYAPADFARILEESGNYKEVTYSGFQKNRGPLGEENYSFTITIKMW